MINLLIGLAAGCFGGLAGLGGGVIMIPLMTGILKIGQHTAHGTSLVALVFTGIAGTVTYALHSRVDISASFILASAAIFTTRAGARLAHTLPEWKLKRYFGAFIILVCLLLLLKPYLYHVAVPTTGWPKILILLLTGMCTGFLSGMMGVGGGTIMVPSMVLLTGFTQYTAQGCSLLAMVPVGMVGAYTHWRLGNVNAGILPGLIPGIVIGTYLGGSLAHILPEESLRLIFTAVVSWTGIKHLRTPAPQPDETPEPAEKEEGGG